MKLYLAGSEAQIASIKYAYKPEKDSNLFMSYFYKNATSKALEIENIGNRQGLITIDSGAHTFFGFAGTSVVHGDNQKQGEAPDPIVYMKEYIEWVKKYYDKISYFVELDIQSLVGIDQVMKWRKEIKKAGLSKKCIMVHHSCDDDKHFKWLLKNTESGYLGFEGKQAGMFRLPYNKLLKEAYNEGIKVHGFALTSQTIMEKWPFYSVDSSSWLATVRYGLAYKFKNGKMHQIKCTQEDFIRLGLSMDLHNTKRDTHNVRSKLKSAEIAFNELAKHTTKVWEARDIFWDKQVEKWENKK